MLERISNKLYVGVVEDNSDPKHLGRVKVRVQTIFDNIPTADIPWAMPYKDVNGNFIYKSTENELVSNQLKKCLKENDNVKIILELYLKSITDAKVICNTNEFYKSVQKLMATKRSNSYIYFKQPPWLRMQSCCIRLLLFLWQWVLKFWFLLEVLVYQ